MNVSYLYLLQLGFVSGPQVEGCLRPFVETDIASKEESEDISVSIQAVF